MLAPPVGVEVSGFSEVGALEVVRFPAEWTGNGGVGGWRGESSGDGLVAIEAFNWLVLGGSGV